MLLAVDFDMRFTYVLAGFEGSAHDTRVLNHALNLSTGNLDPPKGKYYLADAGYSNQKHLLVPYRGVRYHLKEFEASNLKPSNAKELFNLRHSSLRNVVERTISVLKRH